MKRAAKRDRNGVVVNLGDRIRYVGVNEGTEGRVTAFGRSGKKTFVAVTDGGVTFLREWIFD